MPLARALAVLLALAFTPAVFGQIPHPNDFAGFEIGSDGNLLRWERIVDYIETVAAGRDPDLAFDPATGRPTISYQSDGSLMFARFNGLSWDIETVSTESLDGQTSLAFDGSGNPAISYRYSVTTGRGRNRVRLNLLKLARFNGASWDIEDVEHRVGPAPYPP